MKRTLILGALLGLAIGSLGAQDPHNPPPPPRIPGPMTEPEARLPNGKLQTDEILKADHEKDLKDAAQLVTLSEELKAELEKTDHNVLSISSIKKTEEIEKLAKRIRSRIKH
jgi:hypothetical protein